MGKSELIDHLKKNNGKLDSETWVDLAKRFEISVNSKYPKDSQDYNNSLGDTIRTLWKRETLKPQPSGPYQNLKLKKAWEVQRKGGIVETLHSYEVDDSVIAEDTQKQLLDSFKNAVSGIQTLTLVKHQLDTKRCIVLPISDIHIGAVGGTLMSENVYNEEVVKARFQRLVQELWLDYQVYGPFDRLVINDMGDSLDGYNKNTTRGGHTLDQNMGNREQFDVYFRCFKEFIDTIVSLNITNNLSFIALSNSNHDGSFGYTAQRALEIYLNAKYPEIQTYITADFITHFTYGRHAYMLTHGKDEKHMKNGLPLVMDTKTELYLQRYIDAKKLKGDFIHLVKGDLHQLSDQQGYKIRYKSTLSFFGGTEWIHTNFGPNRPGVAYDIIEENKREVIKKEVYFE